ncbi:MAG: hypothetical protein CVV27_18095 [Candidatus Melainabacteria bacterium HGW-Melainabacteria-1]|nr:MAG: hypothetical protein CVV27_18095 [Candidatus Melainabacteria bacterium HGW-Melainabacteria-1]
MRAVWKGFGGILLLNLLVALALLVASYLLALVFHNDAVGMTVMILGILAAIGIGVVQVIYVLPLVFYLKRRQEPELLKGMLLGAGVTLLAPALMCASMYLGPF